LSVRDVRTVAAALNHELRFRLRMLAELLERRRLRSLPSAALRLLQDLYRLREVDREYRAVGRQRTCLTAALHVRAVAAERHDDILFHLRMGAERLRELEQLQGGLERQ